MAFVVSANSLLVPNSLFILCAFFSDLFYMYEYFVYMYICVPCEWLVPVMSEEGLRYWTRVTDGCE